MIEAINACGVVGGAIIRKGNEVLFIILSGVRLSPLGTAATTGLLYQPPIDI
jgi:hypothetical protein